MEAVVFTVEAMAVAEGSTAAAILGERPVAVMAATAADIAEHTVEPIVAGTLEELIGVTRVLARDLVADSAMAGLPTVAHTDARARP